MIKERKKKTINPVHNPNIKERPSKEEWKKNFRAYSTKKISKVSFHGD